MTCSADCGEGRRHQTVDAGLAHALGHSTSCQHRCLGTARYSSGMCAQALYCFVWFLVYVDMGLISSDGVTGTSSDPSDPAQSGQLGGLQVCVYHAPSQEQEP